MILLHWIEHRKSCENAKNGEKSWNNTCENWMVISGAHFRLVALFSSYWEPPQMGTQWQPRCPNAFPGTSPMSRVWNVPKHFQLFRHLQHSPYAYYFVFLCFFFFFFLVTFVGHILIRFVLVQPWKSIHQTVKKSIRLSNPSRDEIGESNRWSW